MGSNKRRGAPVAALVGLAGAVAACTAILGLDAKPESDDAGAAHVESGTPHKDAGTAHKDAAPLCSPVDGGSHSLSETACWESYEIPSAVDTAGEYSGATFDGRYVYFVSLEFGTVVQHDTTGAFDDPTTWSSFNTSSLQGGGDNAYMGLVFDGRYVYVIPSSAGTEIFLRYDSTLPFSQMTSWSSYTADSNTLTGFQGGTFDGRYVYFAPYQNSNTDDAGFNDESGLVVRYDTHGAFTSDASWTSFDMTTLSGGANASGYYGALFDGSYVYFVPNDGSVVARYDISAPLDTPSSWQLFDLSTLSQNISSWLTGVFDGKYVFLVPQYASAEAFRFDTAGSFTDAASWELRSPIPNGGQIGSANAISFGVGGYDGAFVYFMAAPSLDTDVGETMWRMDDAPGVMFATASSSMFNAVNYTGGVGAAVFDGKYFYLAPGDFQDTYFARFQARDVAKQPALPDYFGSFY
jgi:hypothetical protein